MLGSKRMLIGGFIVLGGLLVTLATYADGGTYVITYGAIAIGAIQFLIGLVQYRAHRSRNPEDLQKEQDEEKSRTILRAMLVTAIADGVLDGNEIATISSVYQQLFHASLDPDWIKTTAKTLVGKESDMVAAIERSRKLLPANSIPLVYKAAYLVASADGTIDKKESDLLARIAMAIGLSQAQVRQCLEELKQPA